MKTGRPKSEITKALINLGYNSNHPDYPKKYMYIKRLLQKQNKVKLLREEETFTLEDYKHINEVNTSFFKYIAEQAEKKYKEKIKNLNYNPNF